MLKKVLVVHKRKEPSVKDEILSALLSAAYLFGEYVTSGYHGRPNMFSCRVPDVIWKKWQEDKRRYRALKEMREKKWIHDRLDGREVLVKLHQDAIATGLKACIRKTKKKRSDGRKCLVMFDFPNGASKARNAWRHFLFGAGFVREQLSVWSCHHDVFDLLAALIRCLRIEKWVKVYLVQESGGGK